MRSAIEDIVAEAREMLADDLAALEKTGAELRDLAERAIEVGAEVVVAKMNGEKTEAAEAALESAVQSIKAAGMIELAGKIRKTLIGLFGILIRAALAAVA